MKIHCKFLTILGFVPCKECGRYFHKNKDTACGFSNMSGYDEHFYYCKSCSNDMLTQILRGEEIESN